jgi:hypothetical protein
MHHPGHQAYGPLSGAVKTPLGPHEVNVLLLLLRQIPGRNHILSNLLRDPARIDPEDHILAITTSACSCSRHGPDQTK